MDKSSSPCPLVAITDNGIVINCAGCVKLASLCAKLKITPPLEGVAYIIPCGVWYINGDNIEVWCCVVTDDVDVCNFGVDDVDGATKPVDDADDDDVGDDILEVCDVEFCCLLWLVCCDVDIDDDDWKFVDGADVDDGDEVFMTMLFDDFGPGTSWSMSAISLSLLSLLSAADIFSSWNNQKDYC